MIKAFELRIGNLIMESGEVTKVYMLSGHTGSESINDMGILSDRFTPIPLTEEWLLKLGLIKDRAPNCYVLGDFILFTKNESNEIDHPYVPAGRYIIGINFVHQLQNLYFALIRKELQMK